MGHSPQGRDMAYGKEQPSVSKPVTVPSIAPDEECLH